MVKGKFEFYNNESRMRFFAMKVFPHSVQAENNALLKRLELYKGLETLSSTAIGNNYDEGMFAGGFGGGF